MNKILVTAIGSMSAHIVIQTLQQNGYCVVGTDIYPREWVVNAADADIFYRVSRVDDQERYVNQIVDICMEQEVDAVIPLTDTEVDVLNEHRQRFHGVATLCLSDYKTILTCRDKEKTTAILRQREVCHTIPGYSREEIANGRICFPIVAKPVDGRSSQGLRIFREQEAEEWKRFYERVRDGRYLFQPYLAGNVVTVDVVRNRNTNQCVAVARRELLRTLNGAGLSVQVFRDDALERSCANIAEALDINGCVNFEFIETKDQTRYFLECNPRFSGGLAFSVLSGYDFVMNHLRCFEGSRIEAAACIREHYIARRYAEYITG